MLGKIRQWLTGKPPQPSPAQIDALMSEMFSMLDQSDRYLAAAAETTDADLLLDNINRVTGTQSRFNEILKILDADVVGPVVQMHIMSAMARASEQLKRIVQIQDKFLESND